MSSRDSNATTDQVELKAALQAVLVAFEESENKVTLTAIQEEAGQDLVKLMRDILPVLVEIQQQVIKNYGFTDNVSGVLKFTKIVQSYERVDKEIPELATKLRRKLIPPMPRMPVYVPQDIM